jgi:AraC-like DNA-binding protein
MPTTKKRSVFFEQRTVEVSFRSAENGSPAGLTCSPHLHRELELVYLRSGRVEAFADATRVELGPGDVFLSFPNQIHHYRSFDRKESYILFIIKPDLIPDYLELFLHGLPASPLIAGAGDSPRINTLLYLLLDAEKRKKEPDDGTEVFPSKGDLDKRRRGYLLALFAELLPRMELSMLPGGDGTSLRAIVSYCTDHFAENLSLSTLESELHLNKYYISHLFSTKLGLRFNDYVNSLRINEACRLLLGSDDNVIRISEAVGFNTLRTFNRAFTKQMGASPTEYRKSRGVNAPSQLSFASHTQQERILPKVYFQNAKPQSGERPSADAAAPFSKGETRTVNDETKTIKET